MPHIEDPWKARDAWRYQGVFAKGQRFRGAFPGIGIGFVAFLAYSIYEDYVVPKQGDAKH
ncbi:DEKNAAC104877 [Brettanomyces naardenensis]|uniref:DEKNAAC104877 n=1 Tax=Brettanomyces naardenensis TaxID=13370 RepID=A0A448YS75_BRENA|nr:DEKNAAC104877 [Brettanomyces naardenensis]